MTFTIRLILTVACALATNAQSSNIFLKTFELLHREPPPPADASTRANIFTGWIDQKLDNFDESETATWKMRYMSNDDYFLDGGPIFIFVGGEWAISSGYLVAGHFHDMAKEHNGYFFYTEHRYYGQSMPTTDLSTENLKYLNVKQALADLAHFIRTIKSTNDGLKNSKVILAGGSYSATMVTWFKLLYPDLIVGAWASSAPLLAKVDFYEYKEVTGASIKLVGGEACYNRIQNGIAELENMFANKRGAEVKAMLKLCNTFNENNQLDYWTLLNQISNVFAAVVQTHTNGKIEGACEEIMQGENDLLGMANFILSKFGNVVCSDVSYRAFVSIMLGSKYSDSPMRQWYFETCNEIGWYQTSTSTAQPFGSSFPVDLYITACKDAFGDVFTREGIFKNADDTNAEFGGKNPVVENVYFTHGALDPWSAMGITDKERATVIPMNSHCGDFLSISSSDTPEMRASKEKIAQLVREWVADEKTSSQAKGKW